MSYPVKCHIQSFVISSHMSENCQMWQVSQETSFFWLLTIWIYCLLSNVNLRKVCCHLFNVHASRLCHVFCFFVWCFMSVVFCLMFHAWCLISCVLCLVSDVWYLMSGVLCLMSFVSGVLCVIQYFPCLLTVVLCLLSESLWVSLSCVWMLHHLSCLVVHCFLFFVSTTIYKFYRILSCVHFIMFFVLFILYASYFLFSVPGLTSDFYKNIRCQL